MMSWASAVRSTLRHNRRHRHLPNVSAPVLIPPGWHDHYGTTPRSPLRWIVLLLVGAELAAIAWAYTGHKPLAWLALSYLAVTIAIDHLHRKNQP